MSSRAGWTYNGKHFTETCSVRMGVPNHHHAIDGRKVTYAVWRREMHEAKMAEAAQAALASLLPSVSTRAAATMLAIGGSGAQQAQAQQVVPSTRSGVYSRVVPIQQQARGG